MAVLQRNGLALIAITLAFLAIPAAIGYFAPSRWRIVVIVLWLLLPVFVVAGLVLREVTLAAAPATDFGLYTQAAEFMFVFGVLRFEIFSAAGFAGGLALRKKRAPPTRTQASRELPRAFRSGRFRLVPSAPASVKTVGSPATSGSSAMGW